MSVLVFIKLDNRK